MGQTEVLEAIAQLNEELGRPVTKEEIITATGCTKYTAREALIKLRHWQDVEVVTPANDRRLFRYTLSERGRSRCGRD